MPKRVHELAKELGLKSQELLERIQKWGLEVKLIALAPVDDAQVEKIRTLMKSDGHEGSVDTNATPASDGMGPRPFSGIPVATVASPSSKRSVTLPVTSEHRDMSSGSSSAPLKHSPVRSAQQRRPAGPRGSYVQGTPTLTSIARIREAKFRLQEYATLVEWVLKCVHPGNDSLKLEDLLKLPYRQTPHQLSKVAFRELNYTRQVRNALAHTGREWFWTSPNERELNYACSVFEAAVQELIELLDPAERDAFKGKE